MGKVYVSAGDSVVVQHNGRYTTFRVGGVTRTTGEFCPTFTEEIMCGACNENNAEDYEIGGHHLCPSCVNRALAYLAVKDVLDNVGDYDIPLARTLEILAEEDARMRSSNMPYVDSESAAKDYMQGRTYDDLVNVCVDIAKVAASAYANPGDVPS